jgi:hypothetical protein
MRPIDAARAGDAPTTALPAAARVPWTVWCAVAAVTSAMIGGHWDISWHRSIGRDAFLTPPHIAIYLCGVLGGLAAAWLILGTTFGRSDTPSVRVFGFRGPLGAFICAWGGVAMLTSAPFDDWWHNAYGLDVKIVSPPHTLLALGLFAIQGGALILVLGHLNRADDESRRWLERLFLYIGGMLLVMQLMFLLEFITRGEQHLGYFYRVVSIAAPLTLVGIARGSGHRWASTIVAGVYSIVLLGLLWILPLFPATPKLGPVYYQTTQFIPPGFPLLVIVPAFALDLVRQRVGERLQPWPLAALYGVVWLGTFIAVQWPFATFLLSPAAHNWVFGSHYIDYNAKPWWPEVTNVFASEPPAEFWTNLGIALATSIVVSRLALAWGDWMRRIKR